MTRKINKDIKDMYYMARCNMYKYIKIDDRYYRIVGFMSANYFNKIVGGYIVIDVYTSVSPMSYDFVIKYLRGHIFFKRDVGLNFNYNWVSMPLKDGNEIVDNINESE